MRENAPPVGQIMMTRTYWIWNHLVVVGSYDGRINDTKNNSESKLDV